MRASSSEELGSGFFQEGVEKDLAAPPQMWGGKYVPGEEEFCSTVTKGKDTG